MEITAVISVCKRLGPMQLSAFIAVIPLVHVTETRHKCKAVFPLAQLADPALRVGIVKFIYALFVDKFPVQFISGMLTCFAFH